MSRDDKIAIAIGIVVGAIMALGVAISYLADMERLK